MSLDTLTKKELLEIIRELKEKLKEVKHIESQVTAVAKDLKSHAIGLNKDKDGIYSLIKLKYDIESKASTIEKIESLNSRDDAIALYKLKEYVAEIIMRKSRGGKYD